MNADGSNQVNLTNTPAYSEISPAFSPDGRTIVFNTATAASALARESDISRLMRQ